MIFRIIGLYWFKTAVLRVVVESIKLYQKLNSVLTTFVLPSPNHFIQILLQFWSVITIVNLHVTLDLRPKTLNSVGCFKFCSPISLHSFVYNSVIIVMLESVVPPPKVGVNIGSLLYIFKNNLSQCLFCPIFDEDCSSFFGTPFEETQHPYFNLFSIYDLS